MENSKIVYIYKIKNLIFYNILRKGKRHKTPQILHIT